MKRLAICLGLTRVDPAAYDGWDGACPGCDRDAARFARACHDAGFDGVQVLINQAATARRIEAAFDGMRSDLGLGDLLVLYNSGHGGQQPDENGDELDGRDETLCWWDGEVVDDALGRCFATIRPGVRTLLVTDTCNSGTPYRGMAVKRSMPVDLTMGASQKLRGALLHFGGCADGRKAYGTDQGGVFTNALLAAMGWAKRPLTYQEWFERAQKRMKKRQVPVLAEWGGPSFLKREALT